MDKMQHLEARSNLVTLLLHLLAFGKAFPAVVYCIKYRKYLISGGGGLLGEGIIIVNLRAGSVVEQIRFEGTIRSWSWTISSLRTIVPKP